MKSLIFNYTTMRRSNFLFLFLTVLEHTQSIIYLLQYAYEIEILQVIYEY